MPIQPTRPTHTVDEARAKAASLFNAAARTALDIDSGARLRCIAAGQALAHALPADAPPLQRHEPDAGGPINPVGQIKAALRILGALPLSQFAATDIRDATVQGRRALRLLPG